MDKKMVIQFFTYYIFYASAFVLEDLVFGDTTQDLIEKGRVQYQVLQEKGRLPQYGECWKSAVSHLNEGCRALSEETQSDLALRFTNCFLEMSGLETHKCNADKKPNLRRICVSELSDRAFSIYTEFYTHSQSLCFFLRHQVWHEDAEKTMGALFVNSARVNTKLEEAGLLQETLIEQQKESIEAQTKLLEYGTSLTKTLIESKTSLDDMKHSAREHHKLLMDIFTNLSTLQSWIVGEVSWFDTIIFYVSSILITIILTSTKRTAGARVAIFFILTFNAIVERMICNATLENNTILYIDTLSENLNWYIWISRRITVFIACLTLIIVAVNYYDYNMVNLELLKKIGRQNSEIVARLQKLKKPDTDRVSVLNENNNSKVFENCDIIHKNNLSRCRSKSRDVSSDREIENENETVNSTILSSISENGPMNFSVCSTPKSPKERIRIDYQKNRKPFSVLDIQNSRYNLRSSRQNTPEI